MLSSGSLAVVAGEGAVAALYFAYCFAHSIFVYVGFRYVSPTTIMLVAATGMLWFERSSDLPGTRQMPK